MKKSIVSLSILLLAVNVCIAAQTQFVAGKDYVIIPASPLAYHDGQGKVHVTEFFSYGCPHCFHLEKTITTWLKTKPANVDFKRVPVAYSQGGTTYAKAYYTADALGIAKMITPKLFDAIQKQKRRLDNNKAMEAFFIEQGVNVAHFETAFYYSPGIDAQMKQGEQLVRAYQVYSIPTLVVAGKYKTGSKMAGGDSKRLMAIVNFLIKKSQAG